MEPQILDSILKLYIFLLGLAIGSFLNVCIYRIPRKESIIHPRSRCPSCHHLIPWYYNIPVLSWMILRGRCAYCKAPISLRYPVVETWTGVTFYLAYEKWGLSLAFFVFLIFTCLLIILAFIDWDWQILPNRFTLSMILIGVIWLPWNPLTSWKEGLAGLAIGILFPLALIWFYWIVRREEGMGLGDVKLLGGIGVFLGWEKLLGVLIVGSILGLLYGIFAWIRSARKEGASFGRLVLPFGTFLCITAWGMTFSWDIWWKWYNSIMMKLVHMILG